ncbi:unnamed protein product [Boreogadus saida]
MEAGGAGMPGGQEERLPATPRQWLSGAYGGDGGSGFLKQLRKFSFYPTLRLLVDVHVHVMYPMEEVNAAIQSPKLSLSDVKKKINVLICSLQSKRSAASFSAVYQNVVQGAQESPTVEIRWLETYEEAKDPDLVAECELSVLKAGQTARDRGQTAPDRGQTAPDRGQTAPDRGQTTPDHGQTAPDQGQAPD